MPVNDSAPLFKDARDFSARSLAEASALAASPKIGLVLGFPSIDVSRGRRRHGLDVRDGGLVHEAFRLARAVRPRFLFIHYVANAKVLPRCREALRRFVIQ